MTGQTTAPPPAPAEATPSEEEPTGRLARLARLQALQARITFAPAYFSSTLRPALHADQQSRHPSAKLFHNFPQPITLSLFLTPFYEVLMYA